MSQNRPTGGTRTSRCAGVACSGESRRRQSIAQRPTQGVHLAQHLAARLGGLDMNKIALSPNSLIGVPALEYIDALVKAGYDGIGLRTYASPGVNYESVTQPITGNPALMHDIKSALQSSGLDLYDALELLHPSEL